MTARGLLPAGMRLPFACLLVPLLVGCGGSVAAPPVDGERVPATPLPSEQLDATSGPTGFVTVLSIEGWVIAMPSFFEKRPQAASSSAGPCALSGRSSSTDATEVSAGKLAFTVPLRSGEEAFDMRFDPKEGRYEHMSFEGLVEPGGILQIAAEGETAPAFEAELKTAANVAFQVPPIIELDANAPKDVVVRWDAEGDNDEVFVDLRVGDASVTCWFDSHAGEGTVPAALVSELARSGSLCEDRTTCSMILASKRTRTVPVGDWTMVLAHGFATLKDVQVTR